MAPAAALQLDVRSAREPAKIIQADARQLARMDAPVAPIRCARTDARRALPCTRRRHRKAHLDPNHALRAHPSWSGRARAAARARHEHHWRRRLSIAALRICGGAAGLHDPRAKHAARSCLNLRCKLPVKGQPYFTSAVHRNAPGRQRAAIGGTRCAGAETRVVWCAGDIVPCMGKCSSDRRARVQRVTACLDKRATRA